MADNSKIEWCDATWNPVRGCTKVSPGCSGCYAEVFAERFRGVKGHPYEQGFDLRLVPAKLAEPLRWKTPRRIFVNSMSDLFQDDVPEPFIFDVYRTMGAAFWHTYQVLTKRPERMAELWPRLNYGMHAEGRTHVQDWRHVWHGVSVENRHWKSRIDILRDVPTSVRFLSIEPLLEDIGELDLRGIQWVIVGAESGPHARPFKVDWAQSIIQQCRAAHVACFVKQLGAQPTSDAPITWPSQRQTPYPHLHEYLTQKGGNPDQWPPDVRVREYPA